MTSKTEDIEYANKLILDKITDPERQKELQTYLETATKNEVRDLIKELEQFTKPESTPEPTPEPEPTSTSSIESIVDGTEQIEETKEEHEVILECPQCPYKTRDTDETLCPSCRNVKLQEWNWQKLLSDKLQS